MTGVGAVSALTVSGDQVTFNQFTLDPECGQITVQGGGGIWLTSSDTLGGGHDWPMPNVAVGAGSYLADANANFSVMDNLSIAQGGTACFLNPTHPFSPVGTTTINSYAVIQNGGTLDVFGSGSYFGNMSGTGYVIFGSGGGTFGVSGLFQQPDPTIASFGANDVLARLGENVAFLTSTFNPAADTTSVHEYFAAGGSDTVNFQGDYLASQFHLTHTTSASDQLETLISYGNYLPIARAQSHIPVALAHS